MLKHRGDAEPQPTLSRCRCDHRLYHQATLSPICPRIPPVTDNLPRNSPRNNYPPRTGPRDAEPLRCSRPHRRASGESLADRLAKPDAEPVLEGTCFDGRSGSFLLGRLRQNLADDLWNDLAPDIERSGRCGLVLKGLDRRNHWLDLAHGRVMSDTGSLKQVGAGDYRLTAARSHEPVGAEAAMMG